MAWISELCTTSLNQESRGVRKHDAEDGAGDREQACLPQQDVEYVPGDAPSAFKTPISRVRSSTAVYMDRKTTRKPTSTPTPTTTQMKSVSMGIFEAEKRLV